MCNLYTYKLSRDEIRTGAAFARPWTQYERLSWPNIGEANETADEREFMLPCSEWKRLHAQIQESKILASNDLKATIEVGPEMILIHFDNLEGAVEWKFRFL